MQIELTKKEIGTILEAIGYAYDEIDSQTAKRAFREIEIKLHPIWKAVRAESERREG